MSIGAEGQGSCRTSWCGWRRGGLLCAVNAGSDTVSVFAVRGTTLRLMQVIGQPLGGELGDMQLLRGEVVARFGVPPGEFCRLR